MESKATVDGLMSMAQVQSVRNCDLAKKPAVGDSAQGLLHDDIHSGGMRQ
jgi:hypothetical protein